MQKLQNALEMQSDEESFLWQSTMSILEEKDIDRFLSLRLTNEMMRQSCQKWYSRNTVNFDRLPAYRHTSLIVSEDNDDHLYTTIVVGEDNYGTWFGKPDSRLNPGHTDDESPGMPPSWPVVATRSPDYGIISVWRRGIYFVIRFWVSEDPTRTTNLKSRLRKLPQWVAARNIVISKLRPYLEGHAAGRKPDWVTYIGSLSSSLHNPDATSVLIYHDLPLHPSIERYLLFDAVATWLSSKKMSVPDTLLNAPDLTLGILLEASFIASTPESINDDGKTLLPPSVCIRRYGSTLWTEDFNRNVRRQISKLEQWWFDRNNYHPPRRFDLRTLHHAPATTPDPDTLRAIIHKLVGMKKTIDNATLDEIIQAETARRKALGRRSSTERRRVRNSVCMSLKRANIEYPRTERAVHKKS